MRKTRKLTAVGITLAAAGSLLTVSASSASATSRYGCDWPHVCFYLTAADFNAHRPTAKYKDVTSSFQTLGSRSRGADYVYNSHNDDRVWLRYSNGGTLCFEPNDLVHNTSGVTVTGVKIQTAANC